ncbi:OpgD/OpgG family glucan biosynthesis protein [Alsobacter sp. R-9]
MILTRRLMLALVSAAAAGAAGGARAQQHAFSFDDVVERARRLAASPFRPDHKTLPPALAAIDYDAWRDIRFRPTEALLTGAFRMHMFHPGFLYRNPVDIAVVRNGVSEPVAYDPRLFDPGRNVFRSPLPADLGFAGFRLHFPLNDPGVMDEVAVFLGASYFRVLSRDQRYGISARGIALGSGREGEEFPAFTDFWVEDPPAGSGSITIHAILDGPSVAGAYRFVLWPGAATGVEVTCRLFPRRELKAVGIAPMTSMFFVSENDRRFTTEFRPEVHDSDGLLLQTGTGEWLWRPLRNPASVGISSFLDRDPKGFGLLQRERDFDRYEDLEARYDLRPSYWIEPTGEWGEGHVELVELPARDETEDNIVAFWVPKEPLAAGSDTTWTWRMRVIGAGLDLHAGGHVVSTFQGEARPAGARGAAPAGTRRFLIDFAGGDLGYFLREPETVEIAASTSKGEIARTFLVPHPVIRGFRAGIDVRLKEGETADLRVYLRSGERALTETWTFPWTHALA